MNVIIVIWNNCNMEYGRPLGMGTSIPLTFGSCLVLFGFLSNNLFQPHRLSAGSDIRGERRTVAASESRSLAGDCRVASVDSPTQRRARMAKSLSQDTGCCITEAAAAPLPSSTR